MASSFLHRVEALEEGMGPRICRGSCVKCELLRLRLYCPQEGKEWPGCDGLPKTLTEILLGMPASVGANESPA